jgi:hypothetical protein
MSNNQRHGNEFERLIKSSGLFGNAGLVETHPQALFDIGAEFDVRRRLPTSVKSMGAKTVELADAARFWSIDKPFRLIVGQYLQMPNHKNFQVIHEFLISEKMLESLKGGVSLDEVRKFREAISLEKFPAGTHHAARQLSKLEKARLAPLIGAVMLRPKIDSKSQRRLQSSIQFDDLLAVSIAGESYFRHMLTYGNLAMPVLVESSRRENS